MKYYLVAVCACFFAACTVDSPDNPVAQAPEGPTAKEKAMVPTEMIWQLDSTIVINNPGSLIETYQVLYAGQDTYQWTYTFYPCTYKFPDNIVFTSDYDDSSINISEQFNQDYCKYLCTLGDDIISAGYLCYYKDMFTFQGLQQGGWIDFMIRDADTKWDSDVWTCSFDSSVAPDGTVEERTIEYYSRLRDPAERGGASVTVAGTTFSVYNAYWDVVVANGSDAFYTIQIYNFNKLGAVDPMDFVTIVYKVPDGSQTELATGEFDNFQVSLTRTGSNASGDRQFYTVDGHNENAKLKVTKSGSGYQIQFDSMQYTDGISSSIYVGTAFDFTGGFKRGTLLQK